MPVLTVPRYTLVRKDNGKTGRGNLVIQDANLGGNRDDRGRCLHPRLSAATTTLLT